MRITDRHIYDNDHVDKNDARHYKDDEGITI